MQCTLSSVRNHAYSDEVPMAIGDDDSSAGAVKAQRDDGDVGWEWERDLEAQGHGGCWESSHLEAGFDDDEEVLRNRCTPTSARRTDVRIYEDVCALLSEHPLIDESCLEVQVIHGAVVLRGLVCSAEEMAACEELLAHVHGLERAEILVRVVPSRVLRPLDSGEGDGPDVVDEPFEGARHGSGR
jgi:hypothetical protein